MKNEDSSRFETRSLRTGLVANLIMGVSGVSASIASNADALMVDGLYSGVNFASGLVAAKVAISVRKPPDRGRPYGYDADEAIYVLFRSLVLVGVMAFAIFNSGSKLVHYFSGGEVPELIFGPILIYSVAMVALSLGLAAWHHHNWKCSGRKSEILKTERSAAVVDGMLSAGAGAALMMIPLLKGTALAGLVPVADAIVVLVLCLIMVGGPVKMLIAALGESLGASAEDDQVALVRQRIEQLLEPYPAKLLDVAVTKLGRSYQVVAYVSPLEPMKPEYFDKFRTELHQSLDGLFPVLRAEVIYTELPPFV